jgi:hypothetical protein
MQPSRELLVRLASKYIWWKTPTEAIETPERVIAQAMNIGSYDDLQALTTEVDDAYLRVVLSHAEIGVFNERSWSYWHYRLGLTSPGDEIPAMPSRHFG